MTESNTSLYSTTPISNSFHDFKSNTASEAPKSSVASESTKSSDDPFTSSKSSASEQPKSESFEAPKSSIASSEAPKSTAPASEAPKSDATPDDPHADYLAQLAAESLKERTSVESITNKIRNVDVIEKDGTKIHAQLQAPSYREATIIDSRRSAVITDDGESMVVMTPDKFQEALAKIVTLVTVNGKPFGRFGFKLADAGHVEGYKGVINEADSFLTAIVNPD